MMDRQEALTAPVTQRTRFILNWLNWLNWRALAREFGVFLRTRFAFAPVDWGIAALVLTGALALDFRELARASLWFDETFSVGVASQPLHVMFGLIWFREANMHLYYLMLHLWLSLTARLGIQPTEVIVRAPSAVFAALSSAALYLLARRFLGQFAAIISAIVYSLSFYTLMVAQQARSYSLQLLMIIIAWYMLFGALNEENHHARRWWWALYALATTTAFYAHLYTVFMVVAQIAALSAVFALPGSWRSRARANIAPALVSLGAIAILILPLVYFAHHDGSHISWVQPATPRDVQTILLDYVSSGALVYMVLLFGLIAAGLALAIAGRLRAPRANNAPPPLAGGWLDWRLQAPPPGVTLLLCWMVIPFALTYAITQPYLNLHFFFYRYETVIMSPLCLLVGLGVQSLPVRAAQAATVVALLEIAAVSAPYYYAHAAIQDFRDPVAWMQARYQPGDGLICFPNELCSIPVQAYLMAYPGAARFESYSPGVYSWVKGYAVPPTLARVQAYAKIKHRLFFIVARLGGTNPDVSAYDPIHQWLTANYTLSGEFGTSDVIVYLYTPRPLAKAPPPTTKPGKPGSPTPTATPASA